MNLGPTEKRDATKLEDEVAFMLRQAAAFAYAGDYMGGQARAHAALARLADGDARLRAGVALAAGRYDEQAARWQVENEARHAAYLAREREAIGPQRRQRAG